MGYIPQVVVRLHLLVILIDCHNTTVFAILGLLDGLVPSICMRMSHLTFSNLRYCSI